MWMIANRLSSLDLELNIRDNAPPTLKSARRVYATNCVHVFQSGNDVICNGEGDFIRIRDIDIAEAFEIVQCVFDFYEDWYADISSLIKKKNFQEAVNNCWLVFHNPMILFDGNCKVLGMSEQYTSDELDNEWKYLSTYGYSSVNAINYIKYHQSRDFTRRGMQRFDFEGDLSYSGVTYSLYFNEALCGRINLLEKDRPLNTGDYQILGLLADILKLNLAEQDAASPRMNNNLFYDLMEGKQVDEEELEVQLSYHHWNPDDVYQLFLLDLSNILDIKSLMPMLAHTILLQMPSCGVFQRCPKIIVLCNVSKYNGPDPRETLTLLAAGDNIYLSCSLPRPGIFHIRYLIDQAQASIAYGKLQSSQKALYSFYDHAMDYIIESKSLTDCIQACHPDVIELWNRHKRTNDDMFETLKCYLNNERSLVNTAQALYVHRNTLVYRVKKLTEFLHSDLDDVYTRDYMKLSIRALELYDLKLKRQGKHPRRHPSPKELPLR